MDSKLTIDILHLTPDRKNQVNCLPTEAPAQAGQLSVVNGSYAPGLSLVELIAGFGIIGLISVMIASVYFAHFRIFSNQNTSIETASQVIIALDEIVNQIRQGEKIVNTCNNCSPDTTSSSTLILGIWPLNASGEPFEPVVTSALDYIVYKRDEIDNTKFNKRTIPDAASARIAQTKIIATKISSLSFTYNNVDPAQATEVTVSISATTTSFGRTYTNTQNVKAVLRNK